MKDSRFYPSSKTSSQCETVKAKPSLDDRVFCCEACVLTLDRDVNAAINLARMGLAGANSVTGRAGSKSRAAETCYNGSPRRSVNRNADFGRRVGDTLVQNLAGDREAICLKTPSPTKFTRGRKGICSVAQEAMVLRRREGAMPETSCSNSPTLWDSSTGWRSG